MFCDFSCSFLLRFLKGCVNEISVEYTQHNVNSARCIYVHKNTSYMYIMYVGYSVDGGFIMVVLE
jgi:hypothetical protein